MLPCSEPKTATYEQLAKEIEKLADFIAAEIPGEPSKSESAVDTAIRLLREYSGANAQKRLLKAVEHIGYKDLTKVTPENCPHEDIVDSKCVDCGCYITLAPEQPSAPAGEKGEGK